MRFWRASQGGYTLIELIVVGGILVMLSSLVIANTRWGNRNQVLRDAAGQLISVARQAESMAAGAHVVDDTSDALPATSRPSYGVCTSSSATVLCQTGGTGRFYHVFARKTLPAVSPWARPTAANALLVRTITLPTNSSITPGLYLEYLPVSTAMAVAGSTAVATGTFGTLRTVTGPLYQLPIKFNLNSRAIYL